jgi:hypothetical protein
MTNDLSQYHSPVTDLFPAPESEQGWEACRLTDEQVAFYSEQGYVAGVMGGRFFPLLFEGQSQNRER